MNFCANLVYQMRHYGLQFGHRAMSEEYQTGDVGRTVYGSLIHRCRDC